MAKGRNGQGREPKKPKADKKLTLAPATFLRPQPVAPRAKEPASKK